MKKFWILACILGLAAAAVAQTNLALPAGTSLRMKLDSTLATFSNKQGDPFSGHVTEAVLLNGKTIIPAGATVQGMVGRVTEPRRIKGKPTIALFPHTIILPGGEHYSINASVVDTNLRRGTDVSDEGEFKGQTRDKKDNLELGAGAIGGGTIGALAGGPIGFVIGSGIGAGASTVHWLTKRHSAVLPAGTELFLELNRPMEMTAASAGGQ